MRTVKRTLYLYFRLMSQQIKAIIEYQTDFVIAVIALALTQVFGIVFLWVLFQRVPSIQGWGYWEILYIYSMISFTEGISSFFFNGIWNLGGLVNKGELDRVLLRPISPILQVVTSSQGIGRLGNIVIGGVIIVQCFLHIQIEWSVQKFFFVILLLLSAIIIQTSILIITCCVTFWTGSLNNSLAHTVYNLSDFAKFPITIYNLGVQAVIVVLVPFAFISYFPAAYIFGKEGFSYYGILSPFVALYIGTLALMVFKNGLKRYESTGN